MCFKLHWALVFDVITVTDRLRLLWFKIELSRRTDYTVYIFQTSGAQFTSISLWFKFIVVLPFSLYYFKHCDRCVWLRLELLMDRFMALMMWFFQHVERCVQCEHIKFADSSRAKKADLLCYWVFVQLSSVFPEGHCQLEHSCITVVNKQGGQFDCYLQMSCFGLM